MTEQVCLITGAGRGIGKATAIALDQLGWKLILVSRTQSELENTARQLRQSISIVGDVTRPGDITSAIEAGIKHFGRIDAAVACAGSAPLVPLENTTDEQFQQFINTNLAHTFYLMRGLWPHFKANHTGVFVNISSMASRDPYNGFAAYAAAKAGINLMSLVAAREGAASGIRVHVVAPGAVETAMLRELFTEQMLPPDSALPPEAVAKVITQILAGSLAYTSGEVIYVHK